MDELTLQKSISRARRTVKERCMQLLCDRMLTLTFRENCEDINEAWKCLKYFVQLCRRKWPNRWAYIAVPEYQKRGAVHFHLAIHGFYNVNTLRRLWLRAAGERGGNVDITSPRRYGQNSWNPKQIARYISKYLSKADSVEFNRKRYSSGGEIPPVQKTSGFIGIGLPLVKFARVILRSATRKQISYWWESEEFFRIAYFST